MAVTQSQRAPQIQELFANGVHEATMSYELGDVNLRKEISYNLLTGLPLKSISLTIGSIITSMSKIQARYLMKIMKTLKTHVQTQVNAFLFIKLAKPTQFSGALKPNQ